MKRIRLTSLPGYVKSISDIGINFQKGVEKYKKTVDSEEIDMYDGILNMPAVVNEDEQELHMLTDSQLEHIASYPEIEYVLTHLANELIVYDDFNYFCDITKMDMNLSDDVSDRINHNFKRIYSLFNFNDGQTAWAYMYELLIKGVLAFEIVYKYAKKDDIQQQIDDIKTKIEEIGKSLESTDEQHQDGNEKKVILEKFEQEKNNLINEQKNLEYKVLLQEEMQRIIEVGVTDNKENTEDVPVRIIGFEKLEYKHLKQKDAYYEKMNDDTGKPEKVNLIVWEYMSDGRKKVVLSDNQVIVIKYDNIPGIYKTSSYLKGIIRNFNLMRATENSSVGWYIMYSMFRLKMIIPVGSKTSPKVKEALRKVTSRYTEQLYVSNDAGYVKMNGSTNIPYGKNIVFPKRNNVSPEIDSIKYQGPDISRMELPEYFKKNFWRDSKLPFSRFDKEGGAGKKILFENKGVPYDEIHFYKYVKRVRKQYEIIIKKPLYISMLLDYPELRIDQEFKSKLGLIYKSESYIEEAKKMEIEEVKLKRIQEMQRIVDINNKRVFSDKYLFVVRYNLFSEDEWNKNNDLRKEELTPPPADGLSPGASSRRP